MIPLRFIPIIASMFLSTSAYSADWYYLYDFNDKAITVSDKSAITGTMPTKYLWTTVVSIDPKLDFDTMVVYDEYNCSSYQTRTLGVAFSSKGTITNSKTYPDAKWSSVGPDTLAETSLKFACGQPKRKYTPLPVLNNISSPFEIAKVLQPAMRQIAKERDK